MKQRIRTEVIAEYVNLCLEAHDWMVYTFGSPQHDALARAQDRIWCSMTPAERLEAEAKSLAAVVEQEKLLDGLRGNEV